MGIRYIESWLRGNGAVAIHNLMEDAATAEISRSQLWQWIYSHAITDTGEVITREWINDLLDEEFARLERFDDDRFNDARSIFDEVTLAEEFPTFLTIRPTPATSRKPARKPPRKNSWPLEPVDKAPAAGLPALFATSDPDGRGGSPATEPLHQHVRTGSR
ncbi:malate synthase, glyoxysomal [Arthrobacter sp. Hiyo8]|nr:malate synthase, glyoxysomal [Arthrobacter sp. Hiyo8]